MQNQWTTGITAQQRIYIMQQIKAAQLVCDQL